MIVKMAPFSDPPFVDVLGRETFAFFIECSHGATHPTLVCSDARTIREVADQVAQLAGDTCIHCFADIESGSA